MKKRIVVDHLLIFLTSLLMIGLLMLESNPLDTLPGRDSGFFMYAGQAILDGKLPYFYFWDSKGPGIFYLNALGLMIGNGSRWGVWLLEFGLLSFASYFFYKNMAKKWGLGAALVANAAWIYGLSRIWEGGNLTEEYSLVFSFIVLGYFLMCLTQDAAKDEKEEVQKYRALYILIGVTFAFNLFFRANNIGTQFVLLAVCLIYYVRKHAYKLAVQALLSVGISAGLVISGISIYFIKLGVFQKMIEAAFIYNFFYAGADQDFSLNLMPGIIKIGFPAGLALCGYLVVVIRFVQKKLDSEPPVLFLYLLLGLPVEVVLSSLSGKGYDHYYISWMPAIAMLVGFAYVFFVGEVFPKRSLAFWEESRKNYLFGIVGLVLIYWVTGAGGAYGDIARRIFFERDQGIERVGPVASYIRENTNIDDPVLVWGAYPSLYFLARREAPTAYLFYPAYEESPYLLEIDARHYEDLIANPPVMIVDASSASADYILSLDPLVRAEQMLYNSGRVYTPSYQDDIFSFVGKAYHCVESIAGIDIYIANDRIEIETLR